MTYRKLTSVLIVVAMALVSLAPSASARKPLRSGTIVGGYVILTGPPHCEVTVDCAAWLAADCSPRLVGREPGVFSSIVDVRRFARTKRTLHLSSAWLSGHIEIWSRNCRRIGALQPGNQRRLRLKMPAGARWMSITAGTPALHWELW